MNTRHDMWRPSRWANLYMSRFVSHPEGSKLGSVREDADTAKENRCATNEEAEELPGVDYESDAVRRLGYESRERSATCGLQGRAEPTD